MTLELNKSNQISSLKLSGYKSIFGCDLKMGRMNILIGANGAGKSNFIGFFRLISRILDQKLQITVGEAGGPDSILHFGRKNTPEFSAEIYFGNNGYRFALTPTQDNRLMFQKEALWWNRSGEWKPKSGHFESYAESQKRLTQIYQFVVPAMRSWRVYHFHDTSATSSVKGVHNINDNEYLREDARNLASFLLRLKINHEKNYNQIVNSIKLVAPFFGDFFLRPTVQNNTKIQLEWTEQGQDEPFGASALSDGTLRFICLAVVLLQPEKFLPAAIIIDEPELGLHPFAIRILAGLMKSASQDHQLIISTQSVELVDEFEPEDLIVVDKRTGASTFNRPDAKELTEWLADYSLGELWKKNILGGRPSR